jgi:hypothetical protein
MSKYEVFNQTSGHSFGVYEADSADEAIDACCRDAGYASKADAEQSTEQSLGDLRAAEVK